MEAKERLATTPTRVSKYKGVPPHFAENVHFYELVFRTITKAKKRIE